MKAHLASTPLLVLLSSIIAAKIDLLKKTTVAPLQETLLPMQETLAELQATPAPLQTDVVARDGFNGNRCVDKVEMVEETEYDEVVKCEHSFDRRCHTTFVTNFESQLEEECDDNYRKNCFIEFEKIAFNETIKVCRTPLVKDCDNTEPEVCKTEYEAECWTKQEEHEVVDDVVNCETVVEEKCVEDKCTNVPREVCSITKKRVKKFTPITGCSKEPRELCAPPGCGFKEGPEECHDKTQTVVHDAPKEHCTLQPQRTCKYVTKLVPQLTPTEECVNVPKEVCARARANPKKVKKPVVKKQCFVPPN